MIQVSPIDRHEIGFFWPLIVHHIEASQRRGPRDMTLGEMREACATDYAWRLVIINDLDAAAVLRVIGDRLHVVALAGKLPPGWVGEFFDWLQRVAKFIGLRWITLGGRKGWARLLKPLGFAPFQGPYIGVRVS